MALLAKHKIKLFWVFVNNYRRQLSLVLKPNVLACTLELRL